MTSRIYAGGVEATAKANILADLASYISYNDQGELVLDTAGLTLYLRTQFDSLPAEAVSPADSNSVAAAVAALNVGSYVTTLNDMIKPSVWSSRADWPTSTSVLAGGTMVSAVLAAMTECQTKSNDLTNYFSDTRRLEQILTDYYVEIGGDSLVPQGVVREVTTRTVVYTYVNDWQEESAPSPASALVDMDQNDTATYTAAMPPSDRDITSVRWYRSQTTNNGALQAFYVTERPIDPEDATSLEYTDVAKDEELGEACPTLAWEEPPTDLQGLIAGPNGALAGFRENTFCPSVNYVPYAWPSAYQKTTAWPIVGVGLFDQTYVVLTRGKPYYVSGADSQSLDSQPVDANQACVSRRSIVSVEGGVVYASPDGLCMASASGIRMITEGHFDRTAWQALNPSSILATEHEGCYLFHYTAGEESGCYSLDLKSGKLTTIDATGTAFYRDLLTDTLYLASGTAISSLFTSGTMRTAIWKTKLIVGPKYENFGWLQVDSDYADDVTVRLYRDGTLTDTKVLTSRSPERLSAVKANEHEVEIEAATKITSLTLVGSTQELQQL